MDEDAGLLTPGGPQRGWQGPLLLRGTAVLELLMVRGWLREPFPSPTPDLDSQWPARWARPKIDLQTLIEPILGQVLWADCLTHEMCPEKQLLREEVLGVGGVDVAGMFPASRELAVSLGHTGWDRGVASDSSSVSDSSWPSYLSLSHIGSSVTLKTISCWDINTSTNNNSSHRRRSKHTNISCTC